MNSLNEKLTELPVIDHSLLNEPLDPDFTVSFDGAQMFLHSDQELISKFESFYAQYGFVVVRNVFSAEECSATRDAMWSVLEANNPKFQRDDHSTWREIKSTGKYGLSVRGPCFHPTLVQNRQNLILAKALAQLLVPPTTSQCEEGGLSEEQGVRDLMVSHDRYTVYRQTRFADPSVTYGKEFATGRVNVHLDLNPWWWLESAQEIVVGADSLQYSDPQDFIRENNLVVRSMGRHAQCVLNFADNRAADGGTIVVPCFHRHLAAWADRHCTLRRPLPWVELPEAQEAELLRHAYRVTMREGSVLIWNQEVAHGTAPNDSEACRLAQYLKAYSRSAAFSQIPSELCRAAPKATKQKQKSPPTDSAATSNSKPESAGLQQPPMAVVKGQGALLKNGVKKTKFKVVKPPPPPTPSSAEGAEEVATTSQSATAAYAQHSSSPLSECPITTVDTTALGLPLVSVSEAPLLPHHNANPRLFRRAEALKQLLCASGAYESVTPIGRYLFGLDVLDEVHSGEQHRGLNKFVRFDYL